MRNKITKKNMDLDLRRYGNKLYSKAEKSGDSGSGDDNIPSDNIVPAIIYVLQDEVSEELTVHSIEESLADSVAENLEKANHNFKIMGYKQLPAECTISDSFHVE